jgi:putative effector of murein hydrolase
VDSHKKGFHMTKNLLKYALVVLGLALGTCSSAYGLSRAPEVDSSMAISALTLLGGTLAILRARRQK